jgi:hypothetical protein
MVKQISSIPLHSVFSRIAISSAIPFSIHDEIHRHPPARYETGVISHPQFHDFARLDDSDPNALIAFLNMRCDICLLNQSSQ